MKQIWHITLKVLRIVAGIVLLVVGITGLVLPVLPGWLLIIPGVLILARDIPFFHNLIHLVMHSRPVLWLENRFPQTRQSLHRLREHLKIHRRKKDTSAGCSRQGSQAESRRDAV